MCVAMDHAEEDDEDPSMPCDEVPGSDEDVLWSVDVEECWEGGAGSVDDEEDEEAKDEDVVGREEPLVVKFLGRVEADREPRRREEEEGSCWG